MENIGERGFSPFACGSTLKKCEKGTLRRGGRLNDVRRENGEKTTQLYLNSSFFIYYNALPPYLNILLGEDTRG